MISMKNKLNMYFAIIPVVFFLVSLLIHNTFGVFYQRTTDPEYFHMLSGINFAYFNLGTGYIDHPGTPIQIITAISSWPISWFIPGSLLENVISNPEIFITAAVVTMNLITAFVLFFSAKSFYRSSGSIIAAVMLQLMPFGFLRGLFPFGRLTPESFMIVPIILLVVVIADYYFNKEQTSLSKKQINKLGIIGGLGMALKFSYLPFLFIPLFLIRGLKGNIRYGISVLVSFMVFAINVLFNLDYFFDWFGRMATHSGKWGKGNSEFIDWSTVPQHLVRLAEYNYLFTALVFIVLFLVIVTVVSRNRKSFSKLNKISVGFLFGILLSVFLITKHFDLKYYSPTILFQVILLLIIIQYIEMSIKQVKSRNMVLQVGALLYIVFIIIQMPDLNRRYSDTVKSHNDYNEWSQEVTDIVDGDTPLIISSYFAGCPFPEFSLNGAYLLCGNLKSTFTDQLRDTYSMTNIYVTWHYKFYHWDLFKSATEIFDPDKGVYVFIGNKQQKNLDEIIKRISTAYPEKVVKTTTILQNTQFNEKLYKVELSNGKP